MNSSGMICDQKSSNFDTILEYFVRTTAGVRVQFFGKKAFFILMGIAF